MEKIIACCGLDCATCEARVATLANDDNLRKATAEKWQVMFNSPAISPESINCTGCREEGVKFSHCEMCEIRKCVAAKGFETCGDCDIVESCATVAPVLKYSPQALANLRSLN